MRKRHPNHRLVKIHRSYTVAEISNLFATHRNTVRGWIKSGLQTIDDKRPVVVLGSELITFLRIRRAAKKRPCAPGQMYCVRCRTARFPAGGMSEFKPISGTLGNLIAICPECACFMHRITGKSRLGEFVGNTEITSSEPLPRLRESGQPSLSSDLRGDA